MDRREALRRMALGSAGAVCAPAWVDRLSETALARAAPGQAAAPAAAAWTPRVFSAHQNATVIELSELIIPQTETAGARAARVNEFIDTVLDDADPAERDLFLRGLDWIDQRSRATFGVDFVGAPAAEQTALLTILASPDNTALADREGVAFFHAVKRLTITGYYTSEAGMREELDDDGTRHFAARPGCAHPQHHGLASLTGGGDDRQ